jgi:hypothetical protein
VLAIWANADTAPTHAEYEALGLRIVLYPTMTASAGLENAWQLLNELREKGNAALADWRAAIDRSPWGRVDRRRLLGTDKIRELEARYLTPDAQRDYATTWGHRTTFSDGER